MIQASELRIGNWVKGIALGQYHQIDLFFFHEWYDHEYNDDDTMGDWYEPVRLTPSILEKCGFKEFYNGTFWIITGELLINNDSKFWWSNVWEANDNFGYETIMPYQEVKYLHQLQNIYYSLTNKELKTKTINQ